MHPQAPSSWSPGYGSDVPLIPLQNADPNFTSELQAWDDATLLPLKAGNEKKVMHWQVIHLCED